MPSTSKSMQRFMGMELHKKREGKPTQTGMSEEQLTDFASTKTKNLPEHAGRDKTSKHAPMGRKPKPRGY